MRTVALISPKFEVNVANALRAAAVFGAERLVVVARRYEPATGEKGNRKPRPLRMKAYQHVAVEYVDVLKTDKSLPVVVVEKLEWATPLPQFEHPEDAVYVFGPEDGNVPQYVRAMAKRFVVIPSRECLNLAAAVNVVLYDAVAKSSKATAAR